MTWAAGAGSVRHTYQAMINATFFYVRGAVTVKLDVTNNNLNTPFGKLVEAKVRNLEAELQRWAHLPQIAAELQAAGHVRASEAVIARFDEGDCPGPREIQDLARSAIKKSDDAKAVAAAQAKAEEEAHEKAAQEKLEKEMKEAERVREANKLAEESAKKDQSGDGGKAAALGAEFAANGGLSTTPAGNSPAGTTTPVDQGVKVTGGQFDPAEKQPQPGTPGHKTDPNEGADPVDSNPPAAESGDKEAESGDKEAAADDAGESKDASKPSSAPKVIVGRGRGSSTVRKSKG